MLDHIFVQKFLSAAYLIYIASCDLLLSYCFDSMCISHHMCEMWVCFHRPLVYLRTCQDYDCQKNLAILLSQNFNTNWLAQRPRAQVSITYSYMLRNFLLLVIWLGRETNCPWVIPSNFTYSYTYLCSYIATCIYKYLALTIYYRVPWCNAPSVPCHKWSISSYLCDSPHN